MPIFTSRFSPERSLLGTFLSTRSQRETEKRQRTESDPQAQNRPQVDRLELSDRPGERTAEVRTTQVPETVNRETQDVQVRVSDSRSFAQQLRLRRAAQEAVEELQEPDASTPPPEPTVTAPRSAAEFRLRIRQENQASVQSAAPDRLEGFLNGLTAFQNISTAILEENRAASETAAPERLEALFGTPINEAPTAEAVEPPPETPVENTAVREANTLAVPLQLSSEPPSLNDQQEALREDLRTIANGLRTDAAIENRINVEQTAQTTARASRQQQRQEVQDNQNEIRSLQSSRRQVQQEIQQTDQAIRQLQNRNARLQNSQFSGSGSSLDILAQ
ncbi:MAG: hypothetical protein O7G87_05735 [bacterium]|nr:hypothetical protein [bacterium]